MAISSPAYRGPSGATPATHPRPTPRPQPAAGEALPPPGALRPARVTPGRGFSSKCLSLWRFVTLHSRVFCGSRRRGRPGGSSRTENRHCHRSPHRGADGALYFRRFGGPGGVFSRLCPAYISRKLHIGVTLDSIKPLIHHSSQRCSDHGSNRILICHNGTTRLCWAAWTAH